MLTGCLKRTIVLKWEKKSRTTGIDQLWNAWSVVNTSCRCARWALTIICPNGVRVDGKDRLKHVVNHLNSSAHEEAIRLENCDQAWASKSDSHPWIKLFNKWHSEQLKFLVRISVDAYNDSKVETLSARSWSSRSLSQDHSNYVLQHFESKGWDSEFEPFQPLASTYHYRDPLIYAEMRKIIGTQVMK